MAGFDGRSLDVVCHGAESARFLDEAQAVQTQRRRASSRLLLQLERTLVVFVVVDTAKSAVSNGTCNRGRRLVLTEDNMTVIV